MSPRKTRRGKRIGENVDESVSIIEDSMRQLESPSTHSRSLRTRRNKDPPKETPIKDSSPGLSTSTRPSRRTRGRKTIADAEKTLDSPNTSRVSKRPRKKPIKPEIIDETIIPDDVPEPKKRGRKKKTPETPKLIIDSKKLSSDSEDTEVATASSKIFSKRGKPSNRSLRGKNNSPSIVTPQSSPITVPLTPHRSTKTPRKSPVNLGSPKTHSLSPKRLSKTPRKLSVISVSPDPPESPKPTPPSKKRPTKLVRTPKIVIRKSKSKSPNPKKSPTPKEEVKSEIANNPNSPQLILKRIKSSEEINEKPTPPKSMITSRLHSVLKSEMTSSTPRERAREIRRSLNLSNESPLAVSKFYGSGKSLISDSKALIENVTNPLISEDDDSFEMSGVKEVETSIKEEDKTKSFHKNSTYELAEPKTPNLRNKKNSDDTYELEEPKTPGLRKRTGKRSLSEMNCDNDEEEVAPKRMCRVRFATPESNSPKIERVVFRSRSATPSSKLAKKIGAEMRNVSDRRRSNSLSICDVSGGEKGARWSQKVQNESINRLSKPKMCITLSDTDKKKKGEITGNSAKKVPNFAQIHQKKFEKMESLVEAKKRVAERHNTLSNFSLKIANEKNDKIGTPDAGKNGFNRFGFKLSKASETSGKKGHEEFNRFGFKVRKQEATRIISQPLSVKIQAKKEEKRMALKGVRSNRRFELLMKSRNMQ